MQLGDGGLGTLLQHLRLPTRTAPEPWNLTHPELVTAAHSAFAAAGAGWVQTNTFGATASRLRAVGCEDDVIQSNISAVRCARLGAPTLRVMGSIGPTAASEAFDWERDYREQVTALVAAGVDGIMVETIIRLDEGLAAITAARDAGAKDVWASFTPSAEGCLLDGTPPEAAAEAFIRAGAGVIGANCGSSPESLIEPTRRLIATNLAPVLAMPSAGLPTGEPPNACYPVRPDAFAEAAIQFRNMGVRYFAGCCGVGPDHLRAAAARLAQSPTA